MPVEVSIGGALECLFQEALENDALSCVVVEYEKIIHVEDQQEVASSGLPYKHGPFESGIYESGLVKVGLDGLVPASWGLHTPI